MSRRVLILVLPDVHLQDLAGPAQVFAEASALGGGYALSFHSATPSVTSAQGLRFADLLPLPDPRADDLVLVPGTWSHTLDRVRPPVSWLREVHAAGATVASICSGAFALARAGLLDGRRCTTHWKLTADLQREVPSARVLEDRLFVRDQNLVTSAGVAAGIDLSLSLVEEHHGPIVAARVAREMVVYLRRDGDQRQTSIYLDHRTHLNPGVHRVQDFLVSHPEERASLDDLARLASISPRHLSRVFRQATGVSPKRFAARVKLQHASDLLRDPELTVDAVAERCGFEDPRQLRRLFKEAYGTTLVAYRRERTLS